MVIRRADGTITGGTAKQRARVAAKYGGGSKATRTVFRPVNTGRVEVSPRSGTTFIRRSTTGAADTLRMARENAKAQTFSTYKQAMTTQNKRPVSYNTFSSMVDNTRANRLAGSSTPDLSAFNNLLPENGTGSIGLEQIALVIVGAIAVWALISR